MKPASRKGSSSISVPNGSATSRTSAADGGRGAVVRWTVRNPVTAGSADSSCCSGWASGCSATTGFRVRAAQQRRQTCCAIVPVGKKAAAGLPSNPATRSSSSRTTPSP